MAAITIFQSNTVKYLNEIDNITEKIYKDIFNVKYNYIKRAHNKLLDEGFVNICEQEIIEINELMKIYNDEVKYEACLYFNNFNLYKIYTFIMIIMLKKESQISDLYCAWKIMLNLKNRGSGKN